MKKNIKSSWQQYLIGLVLLILIPTTIWLGLKVVSTKIDYKKYWEDSQAFMKGYQSYGSEEETEQWKERNAEWKKTETFLNHEHKVCVNQFIQSIVYGVFSVILFYIGATFTMPIIAASLILSGLILQISTSHGPCPIIFGLNIKIIGILFGLICLIIVLWSARRDSRN